jgi:peptidoglycan/LPS O-acetylase OafA/YrhL
VRYNPALDGLRAVAILLVLACHTAGFALPGGWVGVDVFFVLSGYLITSILLLEMREAGSVDLRSFYIRRGLRLLPALAILCVFQIGRSLVSHNGQEIREATLVGALYLENWSIVYGWWPPGLMGHTWSLAVEEQFYLIWPLLLPLALTRGLWWSCAAVFAMVAARIVCWSHGYAETTLDFSMLRPVGLLVGCALAFGQWRMPAWAGTPALCAVVLVAVTVSRSQAVFAIAPIAVSLATAIVVLSSPSWLAMEPLRYLGRISYGVYLYHWPLFLLGEKLKPHGLGHFWALGLIALIVGLAALSYEFVEKPFLGLKDHVRRCRWRLRGSAAIVVTPIFPATL